MIRDSLLAALSVSILCLVAGCSAPTQDLRPTDTASSLPTSLAEPAPSAGRAPRATGSQRPVRRVREGAARVCHPAPGWVARGSLRRSGHRGGGSLDHVMVRPRR